jgi:hypothetical protein
VVCGETVANNPAFVSGQPINFALARYAAKRQFDTTLGTDGLCRDGESNRVSIRRKRYSCSSVSSEGAVDDAVGIVAHYGEALRVA